MKKGNITQETSRVCRALDVAPLFALGVGLFMAFYPLLAARFAVGDDYVYIWQISHQGQGADVFRKVVGEGRLVYAFLVVRLYTLFTSLDDLQPARAILFCMNAVAAIAVYSRIGLLLFDDIRSKFWRQAGAASLALGVMVMPGFQVLNSLVEAIPFPLAILLALYAHRLMQRNDWAGWRGAFVIKIIGAILMLVCALNIYQPLAMIFWIPAAIDLCNSRKSISTRLVLFVRSLFIGSVALGLAYLLLQITRDPTSGRAALVADIPTKLRWFFGELLPNALAMPFLQPDRRVQIAILVFVLTGLMLRSGRHLGEAFMTLAAFSFCILLCAIPNLVSSENSATYRSQVALEIAFGVFAVFALRGWGRLAALEFPEKTRGIAGVIMLMMVSVICAGMSHYQTQTLIAAPQAHELNYLRTKIQNQIQDIALVKKLSIISARRSDGIAQRHMYDEFGIPSSFQTWYADAMARVVLKETTLKEHEIAITALPSSTAAGCAENTPCVDMRLMAKP